MVHLHGKLEVVVVEARNLPNLDYSKKNPTNLTDPYVTVKVVDGKKKETKIGKTPTIDDCLNPKWYHAINYEINADVLEIRFDIKDKDRFKDDKIGTCSLPAYAISNQRCNESMLDIINKKGSKAGSLHIKVTYKGHDQPDVAIRSQSAYKASKLKGCVPRGSGKRKSSHEPVTLHGKLTINVYNAENLPNLDMTLLNAKNKTDPFVIVTLLDSDGHSVKVATTKTIEDNLDPVWNETFQIEACHEVTSIFFTVYDQDLVTKEKIASVEIPGKILSSSRSVEGVFDLRNKEKTYGRLKLGVKFEETYSNNFEVPNCINPERTGNIVRLYQDAHCPNLPLTINSTSGTVYTPHNAWMDVEHTLLNAEKFILITGWSVKTGITLVRGQYGEHQTLGRILKNKAGQGVEVRLLLWDEITSTENKQEGAMATCDNETKDYFKNTDVKVSLALRKKKTKGLMPDDNYFTKCCYSHHQKTIITDTSVPGSSQRQVIAYVGGLDLTAGRYDTPDHHLFRTLLTDHKDDFYNNVVATGVQSGPRQPWHDIHCQILGPAAQDVMQNFIDRWVKQGIKDDVNLDLSGLDMNAKYAGQDFWNVQIFRSISQDSVPFYNVSHNNLLTKKGRKIENSLQRAYIHQIQRAEKFMYIENQYFMGSSHFWQNCRDIPVKNLIPLEVAIKIATKIKRKEQFVAYIVVPMFPEGNPEDMAMQEILHWQFHTIEMMYKVVGDAIAETGLDTEPQDYLLFFCVGKRESEDEVPDYLKQPLDETAMQAFLNRRSMIYVHSKMAIFDDEYIIVGSANINDRSLRGTRDTEIAMGAYQPFVGTHGRGEVGCFRKSLWAEHMGQMAPLHMEPGSIQCARKVRQLAEENLQRYLNVRGPLPQGHLLTYPLRVETNGQVTARKDCENFPDTKASVVGVRSKVIPAELTT